MNIQTLNGHALAAAAKRQGAIEANLCRRHGPDLVVHIQNPDGSKINETVYPCGRTGMILNLVTLAGQFQAIYTIPFCDDAEKETRDEIKQNRAMKLNHPL